jgi:hypothetical protein
VAPALLVFGAIADDEKQPRGRKSLHQSVQEHLCLRVNPLEILEGNEER